MALNEFALAEDITIETDDVQIVFGEYMWDHTSFRIGGAAAVYVKPLSEEGLIITLQKCREQKATYWIFGKGTNILVSDRGLKGVVIDMTGLSGIEAEGNILRASAGTALVQLARYAAEHALSGLEFAWGIPGSVGGAVYMNAGAYDGEIKDTVCSVDYMDKNGSIKRCKKEDLDFSYRHSAFTDTDNIIISATFRLVPKPQHEISERMQELMERRKTKQPINHPSAGSVFKRPEGYYAAALRSARNIPVLSSTITAQAQRMYSDLSNISKR